MLGSVAKGKIQSQEAGIHMNILDWKICRNRQIVKSFFAANTNAAVIASGITGFCQVILAELFFGSEVFVSC